MSKYHGFRPEWEHEAPPPGSFRSIFKWGDPNEHKEPNERLYRLMKESFGLDDDDFRAKRDEGLEAVPDTVPSGLDTTHLAAFRDIVGEDDVRADTYARLSVAYGKTMWDLYRLREGVMEHLPDAVVQPHDKDQIERIVAYCAQHRIPITPYGGGSSATRGHGSTLQRRHFLQRDQPDDHCGGRHLRTKAGGSAEPGAGEVRSWPSIYLRTLPAII